MPKIAPEELCTGTVFQAELYPGARGDLISLFVPSLLPLRPAQHSMRLYPIPRFQTSMKVSAAPVTHEARAATGEKGWKGKVLMPLSG